MEFKIPFTRKKVNISMEESIYGVNSEAKKMILESADQLKKYKDAKSPLTKRLIEEEQWYKSLHWELMRNEKFKDDPEPTTAYLFSTLASKHADAMDAYPGANLLPREADDVQIAELLSKVIPLELEYNDFYDVWDAHWWEKLKHGCGVFGIFYEPNGNNDLGSAVTRNVDVMDIFWEPGIKDVQDSSAVFVISLMDEDKFKRVYPDADIKKANKIFEPEKYITDETVDTTNKVLIIDKYYKVDGELHFFKFCGENPLRWTEKSIDGTEEILEAHSEELEEVQEAADDEFGPLYQHGQYPFVFDTLFPEKGSIHGFGYVSILKSPQVYIDKLDQIISGTSFKAGRPRYGVSKSAGINMDDLTDMSKEFFEFEGTLDDTKLKVFKTEAVHPSVVTHRQNKINELKETASNNEFARGEAGGGVTAASAIALMQQAANKVSRDMIAKSYNAFSKTVYLQVEIISEFYDEPRSYRLDKKKEELKDGEIPYDFIEFTNQSLQSQPLPVIGDLEQQYRKPIFDIKVVPEKQTPFNQIAHNELAKEMYSFGMFNPEQAQASLAALSMMKFEGIDEVKKKIQENSQVLEQLNMLSQVLQENQKLKAVVQELTGEDMGVNTEEVVNGRG